MSDKVTTDVLIDQWHELVLKLQYQLLFDPMLKAVVFAAGQVIEAQHEEIEKLKERKTLRPVTAEEEEENRW